MGELRYVVGRSNLSTPRVSGCILQRAHGEAATGGGGHQDGNLHEAYTPKASE